MTAGRQQCIGVYSPDRLETKAFLNFTRHFLSKGLNVAGILAENPDQGIYLLEDLGDVSFKETVDRDRKGEKFPSNIIPLYKSALDHLLGFQLEGHDGMDYSACIPRQEFDRQSIMWDLNHFKYYFIKLLNIPFDEQKLEDDFKRLADFLLGADRNHFMYRDFQSRNIMVRDNELYFIDYQGGRKGALQYDVASLLFEARAGLPAGLREELLHYYLEGLKSRTGAVPDEFLKYYYGYVLIRILQAMGAYGLRGIVENKAVFLQSIPPAIINIKWLLENAMIPVEVAQLTSCLEYITGMEEWSAHVRKDPLTLRVSIHSFSYKKGPPKDLTGHGGGFVFDCRALPNPGRLKEYKHLTGRDAEVIDFLKGKNEVDSFLKEVFRLVMQSVKTYQSEGFTDLMVSFGCTGGQHRSVYCAQQLDAYLAEQHKIKTIVKHKELDQ